MIQYVTSYLSGGNAALTEFDDQKYFLRLANEFHDLLKESPYLYVYAPEYHKYLEGYPHVPLSNVENFIYWSKEDIGTKRRVINITHMTLYQRPDTTIFEVLVASKKIYASHYFEAGLGLTALADDPENDRTGFYLLFLNRWRIDALRHPHFGGLLRKKVRGGLRKLYQKKMTLVKTRLEKMYREVK